MFDALPGDEQEAVVAQLLTRRPVESGDLANEAFVEMADELFQSHDAEEAANATRPAS